MPGAGDVSVGGNGRDNIVGIGVLDAHFKSLGAPGLVGGELEAEDGEELLVHHGDCLGIDSVDADADGRELVGGVGVVAEEGVFDVHGVASSGEGTIQWSGVGGVFVKAAGIILGQEGLGRWRKRRLKICCL